MEKTKVHFTDSYLLNPTNPISVNLIGVGGTGSQVLTGLGRMNEALTTLGHPGLIVRAFDDDIITKANKGRQLFADSEVGLPKAVILINRLNRFFGTGWKAVTARYNNTYGSLHPAHVSANITISCVDTTAARFEIADILQSLAKSRNNTVNKPYYWIDYGNSQKTGQVVLSTVSDIAQPSSKRYTTVSKLPFITDVFKDLLLKSEAQDNTPSCSLADALAKQDLFINPSLADMGGSLLWSVFREAMIEAKGFFMNLRNFRTQPILV